MKNIFLIAALALMVFAGSAQAQSSYFTTSYSVGIPTGEMGDYISNVSFRGIAFDYRKLVKPNVGIGFSTSWNVFFEEKPHDTFTLDNRSLSGKQFRYANTVPLLFSADYYFSPEERFNPYVGLGVGTVYNNRTTDMGVFRFEQDSWNFAFQPQVGMFYELGTNSGVSLAVKYNYGLDAGEIDGAQSYLSVNLGYVFMKP